MKKEFKKGDILKAKFRNEGEELFVEFLFYQSNGNIAVKIRLDKEALDPWKIGRTIYNFTPDFSKWEVVTENQVKRAMQTRR